MLLGFLLLLPKMRFNVPRPFHIRSHIFSFRCFVVFYMFFFVQLYTKRQKRKEAGGSAVHCWRIPPAALHFWNGFRCIPYHTINLYLFVLNPNQAFQTKRKETGDEKPLPPLYSSPTRVQQYIIQVTSRLATDKIDPGAS